MHARAIYKPWQPAASVPERGWFDGVSNCARVPHPVHFVIGGKSPLTFEKLGVVLQSVPQLLSNLGASRRGITLRTPARVACGAPRRNRPQGSRGWREAGSASPLERSVGRVVGAGSEFAERYVKTR